MFVFKTATFDHLLALALVLGSLRPVDVVGVHLLVFLLLLLRHLLPVLPLLRGQALPLLANRLGEVGLALFLYRGIRSRLFLESILAALATEQNKSILRSFDVVLISLLGPTLNVAHRRLSTFVLVHVR